MAIVVTDDAYCTIQDVLELLPNRTFDSETKPTLQQAEGHIKSVARKINAVLTGMGYATPIPTTQSTDILLLQEINKFGAAWMCEQSSLVGVQGVSEIADNYKAEYDSMIEDLRNGKFQFKDGGQSDINEPEGNPDLLPSGTRSEPIFSISEDSRRNKF